MGKTILTGIKSNAGLHIGHYAGVIGTMVDTQKNLDEGDKLYMFIPNLHSFTTPIDHSELYLNTINNVKTYIAAGFDTQNQQTTVWRQSDVSEHAELAWTLSCFTYFGETSRMIQFKEKKQDLETEGKSPTVGLFSYPILQAADILLYDAQYIPIGDDQRQHVELTRDIAIRMNHLFEAQFPDGLFVIPEVWGKQLEFMQREEGIRIRSLSRPEKKMSKSVSDPKGTIQLTDSPLEAVKKIMSATTDSYSEIRWDWKERAGITNLMQLVYLFEKTSIDEVRSQWEGRTSYGDLKKHAASLVETFLTEFQTNLNQITNEEVESILQTGAQKAKEKAEKTLKKVYTAVGLKK